MNKTEVKPERLLVLGNREVIARGEGVRGRFEGAVEGGHSRRCDMPSLADQVRIIKSEFADVP